MMMMIIIIIIMIIIIILITTFFFTMLIESIVDCSIGQRAIIFSISKNQGFLWTESPNHVNTSVYYYF